MDFNEYADKAIKGFGLTGYNNLARKLELNKATLSYFKRGKALPSESTMIKLAELAGVSKEKALIDLNLWRSKNDPSRHAVWQRIAATLKLLIVVYFATITSCFAADILAIDIQNDNAAYTLCDKKRKFKKLSKKLRNLLYPLFFRRLKYGFYYS